jgi:NADH-quinone oxidoreductase subunit L
MLPFYLLLPLAAAVIIIALLKNRRYPGIVALLGSLLSLAMLPFISYGTESIPWFTAGSFSFDITTLISPISYMLIAVILFISPLVFSYATWYMDKPSEQRRFYIEMLAFEAAMLAFAFSGSFITFLIAWEFLSLTSYLLIGFWNTEKGPIVASRKALTMVLIGDLAILGAIGILGSTFGTLDFIPILNGLSSAPQGAVFVSAVLLMIAAFTKSAQFPFHEWLIDAMEGPTPVSAYLHSTTMVKAGVFSILILLPLFQYTGLTYVILVIASITAILATLNAVREFHIKKIIAYSTIQELSLMMIAIAAGAVTAGIYFFFVQSFYKALLFFSSGSVMKATGEEDIRKANGLRSSKLLLYSTLFGVLSLAGFIPFSGFFSSIGISSSLTSNLPIYALLSAISIGTSFYILRWFSYISAPTNDADARIRYKTQPKRMKLPIAILAIATLAVSLLFTRFQSLVTSSSYYAYASSGIAMNFDLVDAASFTVLIGIAAVFVYLIYVKKRAKQISKYSRLGYTSPMMNSFYANFAYFMIGISEGVAAFDEALSDFFDGAGRFTVRSGYIVRRASAGQINYYAAIFVVALVLLAAYAYLV